jgi:DNA-binding CsgD family transcriptional regulator
LQVAASRTGVFIVSTELRVLAWSDALEVATGLRPDQAIGRFCWEVLDAQDGEGHAVCGPDCPLARAAMTAGQSASVEVRLAASPASRAALSTHRIQLPRRRMLVHVLEEHERRDGTPIAPGLSPRQLEILRLLADGLSTEQIADVLTISRVTARNHINAVLQRLDSRSRVEALAKARHAGLVP